MLENDLQSRTELTSMSYAAEVFLRMVNLYSRPPLSSLNVTPKRSVQRFSFDLHVLGTPPAFVLSQDQTLNDWY